MVVWSQAQAAFSRFPRGTTPPVDAFDGSAGNLPVRRRLLQRRNAA